MMFRKPVLVGLPMLLVPLASLLMPYIPIELRLYVFLFMPIFSAIGCYGMTLLLEESDFDDMITGIAIYALVFIVVGMLLWARVGPPEAAHVPGSRWIIGATLTISGLFCAVVSMFLAVIEALHEKWKKRGKATTTE